MRIIEDFAKSIADAFHVDENKEKGHNPPLSDIPLEDETWETVEDWKELKGSSSSSNNTGAFFYYGTDDEEGNIPVSDSDSSAFLSSPTVMELLSAGDSVFSTLFRFIREKALMEINFATESTEGVPALATDLLGVLFICFISSVLLLRQKRGDDKGIPSKGEEGANHKMSCQSIPKSENCLDNINCDDQSLHLHHTSRFIKAGLPVIYSIFNVIKFLLLLPIYGLSLFRRLLMNRYIILFIVHFFGGWLLCISSQFRSLEIQR